VPRSTKRSTKQESASTTDVPSTIARSDSHAQAIYTKVHDAAVESYGEGERAHRTAFSALKHSYEKVGDHWEAKDEKGPSDAQSEQGGAQARDRPQETAGGVDANASKKHLVEVAARLDIRGRTRMDKAELVDAIQKANNRHSAASLKAERSGKGSGGRRGGKK
jgi:cation transport regulator ChaB